MVALGAVTTAVFLSTSASGAAQQLPVHDPAQNAWPFHLVLTALAAGAQWVYSNELFSNEPSRR